MGQPSGAQCSQRLGRPAPTNVAARIWPTRNVGASRTGHRWLWPTPCGQRSPTPAPTLHLLHRIYTAWRLPTTTGLPTGLWCSTTVQFWLRSSAPSPRSVRPSRGPSSTCHPRGCPAGLPTTSVSGCPRHEQTPNSPAGLPLWSIWLRAGLERLRPGLLGPQPAAPLLWGPLCAGLRGSPCWWQWLRTRAEPQRAGLPSLPALARGMAAGQDSGLVNS